MRVIVCGAGKVGTSIAEQLVNQNNDVTVIDQSEELILKLSDEVDLNTIVGSASYPSILTRRSFRSITEPCIIQLLISSLFLIK